MSKINENMTVVPRRLETRRAAYVVVHELGLNERRMQPRARRTGL